MVENEVDNEDIEQFVKELNHAIFDISKKHGFMTFPALVAAPVTMLDRMIKYWKSLEDEEATQK